MDKSKLKKMALLGMAGGMVIASQGSVNAETTVVDQAIVWGHECGAPGSHSCNSGFTRANISF